MSNEQSGIKVEYGMDVTLVTFNEERIVEENQIRQLHKSFEPVIEQNQSKKMVLNFDNVKFMTSAMLGLLVRIHKNVTEQGGRIQLCNMEPNIQRIFEITKLTKIFEIT